MTASAARAALVAVGAGQPRERLLQGDRPPPADRAATTSSEDISSANSRAHALRALIAFSLRIRSSGSLSRYGR